MTGYYHICAFRRPNRFKASYTGGRMERGDVKKARKQLGVRSSVL